MNHKQEITFTVNGIEKSAYIRYADTVLHMLREHIGITSVKPGCHNGDCGSCTILVDDVPFNACHMLAIEAADKHLTTLEGIHASLLQEKFIKNWAIQCGYCTPGFILNCYGLLKKFPDADDKMMEDWLDSNICRCTGYQEIKVSVKQALQEYQNSAARNQVM